MKANLFLRHGSFPAILVFALTLCATCMSCTDSKKKDTAQLMAEKGGWRGTLKFDKSLIDDSAIYILRSRLEAIGIESPGIRPVDGSDDMLMLELPGVNRTNWIGVSDVMQKKGNLEFFLTYAGDFANIVGNDIKAIDTASGNVISSCIKNPEYGRNELGHKTDGINGVNNGYTMLNPIVGYFEPADTAKIGYLLRSPEYPHTPGIQYRWGRKPEINGNDCYYPLYALKSANGKPRLTGDCITSAEALFDANYNSWLINLTMDRTGARHWEDITGENIGWPIAIVLDDTVLSAPYVNGKITGGKSIITSNFSKEEAAILASLINSGKMDYRVDIYSSEMVPPKQ